MFVKQLIGRMAGTVVDMPYFAATSNIAAGICVAATEEEIAAAGLDLTPVSDPAKPEALPVGYQAEVTEGGGYDLVDAGGVRLNQEPFANMAAVLSFAHDHLSVMAPVAARIPFSQIPSDQPPTITLDNYRFEAFEDGGIRLFDPAGAPIGGEAFVDEEAARLAAREHYAESRGRTLNELEAEEIDPNRQAKINVPEDWKGRHHTYRRALAQRIKGEPVANTAEADEVIEEYVTRPR